jgi:Uma2 family endonuclease
MVHPKRKRREATYQDVLDAPEHVVAEIVDGELYVSPRPAMPHARSISALSGLLIPPFDFGRGGPGGWVILIEPELHFGKQIVVPDMAGWRRERLPAVEDVPYMTLAPDWVCEGLSPSTQKLDRTKKMRVYAKAGVGHAWLVDAKLRTLEVYRLHEGNWLLVATFSDAQKIRAEPFDAIAFSLGDLWSLPTRASERAARYAR